MSPKKSSASSRLKSSGGVDQISQQVCGRMRELRKERRWTLEQLAAHSGVSRSMLSQIERQAANPTLGVVFRIAQAFGMSLSELVDDTVTGPQLDVIRSDDAQHTFRDDDQVRIRTLSPLHLEKDVEFYELLLRAGGVLNSAGHFEGTREFLTIEKGSVEVISGDQQAQLEKGDSAHYPADVPHCIANRGDGEAVAFLVNIYPRP